MTIEKDKVERLGIYSFYDKDGIVDRYIEFFLDDFRKNVDKLIIVSNGKLPELQKRKLEKFTDDIINRENKGFDIWGYKCGMDSQGWEELQQYDEIVLTNNTLMGPIYPFEEMFTSMKKKDVDFWGITRHYAFDFDPTGENEYGYIPEHIQSFFMVFRKNMVESIEFQKYWDNLPELDTYEKAVGKHETMFTKKFADKGFKWDTYVDTDDIKSLNEYPLMVSPRLLLEKKRCPVFKRRTFFQPYDFVLHNSTGQSALELMNFLKKSKKYDVDLIWENILRTCNQADFAKSLHLIKVFSSQDAPIEKIENELKKKKIALVMHLYFEDLLEESFYYASTMPETADVYITTNTIEKKKSIERVFAKLKCNKLDIRVIENRGRDVSSVLVGVKDVIMDYDIACFVHDKKTAQLKPGTVGEGFAYKCFENTLHNKNYVYNVINEFLKEPRLGIMSPPGPNHGPYFAGIGNEWTNNFDNTVDLAKKLGIKVPIDAEKEPLAPLGTFFWFRPKAFEPLYAYDWKYEDFPEEPNKIDGTILHAVERIYPLAVQQAGYYPAIQMVDTFAGIEVTNLQYFTREYNKVLRKHQICGEQHTVREVLDTQLTDRIEVHNKLGDAQKELEVISREYEKTLNLLPVKIMRKLIELKKKVTG